MDTPRPQLLDFQFHQNNDSFTLHFQQRLILTHSKDNPCLWIGSGIADIDMFRGNFSIKDKLQEKIALTDAKLHQIVTARGIFCQIAVLCRFFAEIFIAGNIRVDIGQELHALLIPLLNA